MYALFEDSGKFLAGRRMSEAESSMQVELDSGKRIKVKAANVLLRFEKPAPADLLAAAQSLSAGIELDLAWEFAPEDDFAFADLAAVKSAMTQVSAKDVLLQLDADDSLLLVGNVIAKFAADDFKLA